MNLNKRLARLENFIESNQMIDPYKTERYKLMRKANGKLTEEERLGCGGCLLKWKKNGGAWTGIEHEKQELIRLINLGLSRLTEKELKNYDG